MERKTFVLAHAEARRRVGEFAQTAPDGWHVTFKPPTRSLDANARMWAMLTEVSRQVVWHGRKLSPEDWKHMFTATLKRLDVVPNLDGTGFVALGMHTSTMTIRQMSDLMELIAAFGAERGVRFMEPAEA